ncbi:cobyric acid synthase CobQ [Chamaesiphon sp. VAR_48_metabat_135_sub]|uniref:cobyric acid synthase CobQ n=1 Tax=Chamaesiphon sp. VAR_48_metabat_135_sub TaxID=2964699 RepID=UPI00286D001C|nr:cobyric acid synthase CobQ [Chamaesiphon sp. VAR_48_metabat_135_sub]
MVVGTTSHAGKSLITAAICRLLVRQGFKVTPFKGQNMALNAYITADGKEMGHAQAVQAWAAKIEPRIEMNPILLKPQGDMTSQVILMGSAVGRVQAADYYRDYFDRGWAAITNCLDKLAVEFDYIVCEGAGSPAEINLKHRDLTNMRVASYLQANTVLVADIDRGGVFAHIVGTLELLEPEERALIKGFIINKFRGQRSLLESGIRWLEERTGIPVIGVIPMLDQVFPSEDSLDLLERRSRKPNADLTIGVVRFPRISNFTDFDPIDAEPTVNLKYITTKDELSQCDGVILPGSKTTIADLNWLQQTGIAAAIPHYLANGGTIMGICGGFQMLGSTIADPTGIEGIPGEYQGLNLFPLQTIITEAKITRQRATTSNYPQQGISISGYEIHQGTTKWHPDYSNIDDYELLFSDRTLGIVDRELTLWGTYLHGIFDNGRWRRNWLNQIRSQRNLALITNDVPDYANQREEIFDKLADSISDYLDLTSLTTVES